jgi:hypothetical protein
MVEDKVEAREATWRQLFPWTELFRGFKIALDPYKLLLAAAGILVMAFGWWLLGLIFWSIGYDNQPPGYSKYQSQYPDNAEVRWQAYKQDRDGWNLMHEATGRGEDQKVEVEDLADSEDEYNLVKDVPKTAEDYKAAVLAKLPAERRALYAAQLGQPKRAGTLSAWPWSEERGPNPYLLVTGQAGVPWEPGHFWEWFTRHQVPVMIEPLIKMVRPIVYFFSPRATFLSRFYFLLVTLFTLAVWSFFGGAITRIAAVQIARGEKIGLREAVGFARRRFLSYVTAPLFPFLGIFLALVLTVVFIGIPQLIPGFGDFWSGFLWPLPILAGVVMACLLVGLIGWPLMAATISTEGTDSWEGVSHSFHYVYQQPWQLIWYSAVAIAYGAVLVFFVGFMGSLTVYLAKWSVAQTPFIDKAGRDPSYLFIYAPTSFGWRDLLLESTKGKADTRGQAGKAEAEPAKEAFKDLNWWNKAGAGLVAFWLGLLFLLVIGFGYSYFWAASTIVYFLLRHNVDRTEMDEVYLDEDEQESAYTGPLTTPAPPPPVKTGPAVTMVEPPALRPATPPVTTPTTHTAPPTSTTPPATSPTVEKPVPTDSSSPSSTSPPETSPVSGDGNKMGPS